MAEEMLQPESNESESEKFIENVGNQIGGELKELLRQAHNSKISTEEFYEKINEKIQAALMTLRDIE